MRKLLIIAFLACIGLQSCKLDEAEVAPANTLTPAGVNIESAVKSMKGFVLEDYKAILLKPVDEDPTTHLTTLYIANDKGGIFPVIENFEVKRVEVTNQGIYVLTNYSENGEPIAFFVKYDNSWLQLKGVGEFLQKNENGDVLFRDGSILRAKSLQVEKIFSPNTTDIISVSGNLLYVEVVGTQKVINTVTNVEHDLPLGDWASTDMLSLLDDKLALMLYYEDYKMLNMTTGELSDIADEALYLPKEAIRNAAGNGIIALSEEMDGDPGMVSLLRSMVTFGFSGSEVTVLDYSHVPWDRTPLDPYNPAILNTFLSNIAAYAVEGTLLYYSGTDKAGQPATGVYDFTTKQNVVVAQDTFTSISAL